MTPEAIAATVMFVAVIVTIIWIVRHQ